MAEDWDTLLLLDACRYDVFADHNTLAGTLESRISRGSSTREFLVGNLKHRECHDVVYVTASPMLYRNRSYINVSFHAEIDVWSQDGWDPQHQTVLPETMTERTRQVLNQFPNKRLFVHFIQPHYPFITTDEQPFDSKMAFQDPKKSDCWDQMMKCELETTPEEIWDAYKSNLKRVLSSIRDLPEALGGKTVVTSDHGNMIGERAEPVPVKEWGHPHGIWTRELVKVPWFVTEHGERRDVTAEHPQKNDTNVTEEVVSSRLNDLGYIDI
jgi:hypothetical protein